MKLKYYDPIFYLSSEKMPFNIRLKVIFKDDVDAAILNNAVNTSLKRYPYFKMRVVKDGESYVTVDNDLPVAVLKEGECTRGQLPYACFHIP